MTEPPLPPTEPSGTPVPWNALDDLAAGELAPEAARALLARMEAEPALRQAYAEARRLEARLRAEGPYAAPVGLTGRILRHVVADVVRSRPRPLATLARVAALVLVFFSSWLIVGGETPALASVGEAPLLTASLPAVETSAVVPAQAPWYRSPILADAAPARRPGGPPDVPGSPAAIALAGLGTLLGGLYLAARWHRPATRPNGGGA